MVSVSPRKGHRGCHRWGARGMGGGQEGAALESLFSLFVMASVWPSSKSPLGLPGQLYCKPVSPSH